MRIGIEASESKSGLGRLGEVMYEQAYGLDSVEQDALDRTIAASSTELQVDSSPIVKSTEECPSKTGKARIN